MSNFREVWYQSSHLRVVTTTPIIEHTHTHTCNFDSLSPSNHQKASFCYFCVRVYYLRASSWAFEFCLKINFPKKKDNGIGEDECCEFYRKTFMGIHCPCFHRLSHSLSPNLIQFLPPSLHPHHDDPTT